jgi:hypothetical protein
MQLSIRKVQFVYHIRCNLLLSGKRLTFTPYVLSWSPLCFGIGLKSLRGLRMEGGD